LPYYYAPFIGRVFQARINLGLGLLHGHFRRLLEIGYGSGLLLPTLGAVADELHGVDLVEQPPGLRRSLERLGVKPPELVKADIQGLPYPDGHFDAVVAFSILEHLKRDQLQRAAVEVARVLEPGGVFLVGCPAVHKAMNGAFAAIGFRGIENHHFSGIPEVVEACAPRFEVIDRATLPRLLGRLLPLGWAPYTTILMRKRRPTGEGR